MSTSTMLQWLSAILLLGPSLLSAQQTESERQLKPYRLLLVVSSWADPRSLVVTSQSDSFQPVAALLKAWSVPFEILRLDQETLGASQLYDRNGRVRYGAVLWLADDASYAGKNVAALEDAAQAGTSVLSLGARGLDPHSSAC